MLRSSCRPSCWLIAMDSILAERGPNDIAHCRCVFGTEGLGNSDPPISPKLLQCKISRVRCFGTMAAHSFSLNHVQRHLPITSDKRRRVYESHLGGRLVGNPLNTFA